MEKIFKKSLALVLSAALCLTALLGCLTVSADETTTTLPTYKVEDVSGKAGDTVTVKVNITDITNVCAHYFAVKFPAGLTVGEGRVYKSVLQADGTYPKQWVPLVELTTGKDGDYKKTETDTETTFAFCDIVNFGTEIVNEGLNFEFDVTIDKNATAGDTYSVEISATAANYDEQFIEGFVPQKGTVTVESQEVPHEHTWDDGVVTLRPTLANTGVRTFTCSGCDAQKTEVIPVAVEKNKDDGDIYKVGHSLDLQSNIQIMYLLRPQYINDAVSYYAVITKNIYDLEGNVISNESVTFENNGLDFTDMTMGSSNRKCVKYKGIKSTEMATIPHAEFYRELSDGTFECIVDNYGITSYANAVLPSSAYSSSLKTLVVDLLNYGTAAQKYFGYNTANLANANFAEYASLATSTVPSYSSSAGRKDNADKIIRLGRSLDMASSIAVVADINNSNGSAAYAGDLSGLRAFYKYKDSTGEEKTGWLDSKDFAYNTNSKRYAVYFDKFTSREMSSAVELSIYDGDVLVSDTITYSIESYMDYVAKNYNNLEKGDLLKDVMECMLKYGYSANRAL